MVNAFNKQLEKSHRNRENITDVSKKNKGKTDMGTAFWMALILILTAFFILSWRVYTWIKEEKIMIYDIGALLDIGKRQVQANAYGFKQEKDRLMAILSAGEGKEYTGKVAALTTVRTFTKLYNRYDNNQSSRYFFDRAFETANMNVLNALRGENGRAYAACLMLRGNLLSYAIMGHINIYIFRRKELILLSKGQIMEELIKEKVNKGLLSKEAARRISDTDRAYNCIGRDDYMKPLMPKEEIRLKKKDMVVIMTAGVEKNISVRELEIIISRKHSCNGTAKEIIETIKKKNNEDLDNLGLIIIGI
ncbi:hypothetical protein HMPREF1495_2070 [Lachnoanaerobaculum sp. MSX33]|nr:hypothetical protein HMPREF1495_2070 [Lachnoanaerobaculum sp. MSX33]